MAIDQTEKRKTLARQIVAQSAALMDIVAKCESLRSQYSAAGLSFADSDFTGVAGLAHMDAASAENVLGSIEAIGKFIRGDNTALTGSHITNFEKARA